GRGRIGKFPQLVAASVQNAQALLIRDKHGIRRFVAYDPAFFTSQFLSDAWAPRFALAHELGHHVEGHLLVAANAQEVELQADAFATRLLKRLGASESDILLAMGRLPLTADAVHPDATVRLGRSRKAYNSGDLTSARARCLDGEDAAKCRDF